MTNQELLDTIYLLREKAELNKLVVFIGAGVSKNVPGMPGWGELIAKMAETIGYSKCDLCRHKHECRDKCGECPQKDSCTQQCFGINDFSSDEYLKIPQYVYNKSQEKYRETLCSSISGKAYPDAPLSKAIFEINPAHIITTNYDKLLESSNSEFCKQYDVIVSDKDLLVANKSKYIIKMHGDVSHPETIVLKEQDYLEYSQKHVLMELFVKSLLADHTILFLGYSLNDYNVKQILSWINYLRSQNDAISKDNALGYIVLDEDSIDDNQLDYYSNNCIKVINIRDIPCVKSIPPQLGDEKGRRLYSFLSVINNPYLENDAFSQVAMEHATCLLTNHRICDYSILLSLLCVSQYHKVESMLQLYNKEDYSRLVSFLSSDSENASKLRQVFANTGIQSLYYSEFGKSESYSISAEKNNELFENKFFSLYIQNRYRELLTACLNQEEDVITNCFYQHFLLGYVGIEEYYRAIDFESLGKDDQVAYLHNMSVLDVLKRFNFDAKKTTRFINNIASEKERSIYQPYLDIYNGNASAKNIMVTALDSLKRDILAKGTFFTSGRIHEIYNIQNIAYSHYLFRYMNHLLILGLNDAEKFFRPYIEAIIQICKDSAQAPSNFMGVKISNREFAFSIIDFDILTKYISTKDLFVLISSANITKISANKESVSHVVNCFINMIDSLVVSKTYGFRASSISVLSNLALLIIMMDIHDEEKILVSTAVQKIFNDETFNQMFWTIDCPGFKDNIKAFSMLLEQLAPCEVVNCVHSILEGKGFYDCVINSDFNAVRRILHFFLRVETQKTYESTLCAFIDSETNENRKIILLRLLFDRIIDNKKRYIEYLVSKMPDLNTSAIYDFVFAGWINPTQEDADAMIKETLTLSLKHKQENGITVYPDPSTKKLECIILLYITDRIKDISGLEELSAGNTYLSFLLHPDTFDYTEVDFSDYMWVNFAHQSKYRRLFIEHKDSIIPLIHKHMKEDSATDVEKRILYGFLLDEDEIWGDL